MGRQKAAFFFKSGAQPRPTASRIHKKTWNLFAPPALLPVKERAIGCICFQSGEPCTWRAFRFKEIRTSACICAQINCITYTQALGNLWINFMVSCRWNSIHRIPPKLRPTYEGGFEAINPIYFNDLILFSTKSGSTITTKL